MSSSWRAVGVAALCVAALAGCSRTTAIADHGRSGPRFHLAQAEGGPVESTRTLRTTRVSAPPPTAYEWTVASADPSSDRLRLFYTDGACVSADRMAVAETATAVVIGITASRTFKGSCVASGTPRATIVQLRKPLGGRALMEGATIESADLPAVSTPSALPGAPACSTLEGDPSDVPAGMPDAATRIAPTGVTSAFVCRTWWPKGSARVRSTTVTDRAALASLVDALDSGSHRLRPGAPNHDCQAKDPHASWYAITLEGPGRRVEVRTDAISCDTITNGAATGTMTPALVRLLDTRFGS